MQPDTDGHWTARSLRAMKALTCRLILPLDQPVVLNDALELAAGLVGADAGMLPLLDHEGGLAPAATYHAPAGFLSQHPRIIPNAAEFYLAMESSGPVVLHGEPEHPALRDLRNPSTGTLILAPLGGESLIQGVLVLRTHRRRRKLPQNQFLALQALTDMVAVAIRNHHSYSELERISRVDHLTGLITRRHFGDLLRRELARARRTGSPVSLAMIDIDRLKWINDTFGHAMGDQVIAGVGELLQHVRLSDVVARLGGDEFVILMPDTGMRGAEDACDRFRARLDQLNRQGRFPFPVRVSIGVREMSDWDGDLHGEDLLARADAAMYDHKKETHSSADPPAQTDGR